MALDNATLRGLAIYDNIAKTQPISSTTQSLVYVVANVTLREDRPTLIKLERTWSGKPNFLMEKTIESVSGRTATVTSTFNVSDIGFHSFWVAEAESIDGATHHIGNLTIEKTDVLPPPPPPPPPGEPETVIMGYNTVGDEIVIPVTITNNTQETREYRAFVYNSSGFLLDKEPDLRWNNIQSGNTETIKVSSRYDPRWDINNVYPKFRVRVFEQNLGYVTGRIMDLTTGTIFKDFRGEGEGLATSETAPPITIQGEDTGEGSGKPHIPSVNGNGFKFGFGTALLVLAIVYLLSKKKNEIW